jgi:F0F1-type ATP synthase assembly protein I
MRHLSIWQAVAYATELGAALATGVVVGLVVGRVADTHLDLGFPAFTLVGVFAGLAAGVYSVARMAQQLSRPRKE